MIEDEGRSAGVQGRGNADDDGWAARQLWAVIACACACAGTAGAASDVDDDPIPSGGWGPPATEGGKPLAVFVTGASGPDRPVKSCCRSCWWPKRPVMDGVEAMVDRWSGILTDPDPDPDPGPGPGPSPSPNQPPSPRSSGTSSFVTSTLLCPWAHTGFEIAMPPSTPVMNLNPCFCLVSDADNAAPELLLGSDTTSPDDAQLVRLRLSPIVMNGRLVACHNFFFSYTLNWLQGESR